MFQLISIAKSLLLTLVVVLILQVKIGNDTLEDRAVFWFRSSPAVQPLQTVVDGGVRLITGGMQKMADLFSMKFTEKISDRPGQRDVQLKIERSRQYIKEQAEKMARKMESEIESTSARASKLSPKMSREEE